MVEESGVIVEDNEATGYYQPHCFGVFCGAGLSKEGQLSTIAGQIDLLSPANLPNNFLSDGIVL